MAVGWRQDQLFYKKYFSNILLLYKSRDDIKIFLEILLSLATVVIFILFAIKPTLVTIASLLTEINAKQEVIAQMDTKIQSISNAQQIFEQKRSTIALLDSAVPSNPDIDLYIRQTEGITNKNTLVLEGINTKQITILGEDVEQPVGPPQDPNEIQPLAFPSDAKSIDFSINVSGAYQGLANFLKDIRNLRRPILIDNSFFGKVISSNEEKLILTVVGKIPYVK